MSADNPVTAGPAAARVPRPRARHAVERGGRLAGFDVVAELGRGGRSTVYRVRHPDRPASPDYALKLVDLGRLDSRTALLAFRREAALLASVDHPGLARIHEVGEVEGRPYLVMDLVAGRPLSDVLRAGPLEPAPALALALDLADPLAAVHRQGLIHRDLKPANIMLLDSGAARLIDFGLSGREDTGERPGERAAERAGDDEDEGGPVAVGTLAYASPEQSGMLRRPVDKRSDLYSLGVVLFECLTGRLPFEAADAGELLRQHAVSPAPDLSRLVVDLPAGLAAVVAKLLAKDPDDRYQSGEELIAALRAVQHPAAPAPDPGPGRFHQRPLAGRSAELARLRGRWAQARTGHGGAVLIRGAGGTGKTSLARALAGSIGPAPLILWGTAAADDPLPFSLLRAAVDRCLVELSRAPAEERDAAYERFRAACPEGAAPILAGFTPLLGRVLAPDALHPPERPGDQQDPFVLAVAGLLTGLAREFGGLLMLVGDVHWIDPGSLRVLEQLAPGLAGAPLLVVGSGRPEYGVRGRAGADDDVRRSTAAFTAALGPALDLDLALGPLDDEAVAAQIRSLLPGLGPFAARMATLVGPRSQGNPFVVQEYLSAIIDAGLLQPSWGSWRLDEEGLAALDLPQDALGLVLARVEGLGTEATKLLSAAAAIGPRFRPELLAELVDADPGQVLTQLAQAGRRQLIEPRGGGEFAFLHERIRAGLLERLPAGAVLHLHRRIAELLRAQPPAAGTEADDELVSATAHHFMLARPPGGDPPDMAAESFAACLAAGRRALAQHAPEEASAFLRHAATSGRPLDATFLTLFGRALKQAGNLPEALERLDAALALESDPVARAAIHAEIAEIWRYQWDAARSSEALNRGLDELGARPPRTRGLAMVTGLLLLGLGWLIDRTGIGRVADRKRARAAIIAQLHEGGHYLTVIDNRPDFSVVHGTRSYFWGCRLGHGWAYIAGRTAFAQIVGFMGRGRTSLRMFDELMAHPDAQDPALQALIWQRLCGMAFITGLDNGQSAARAEAEHGRWMDIGGYLDIVGLLRTAVMAARGLTADAERLQKLGDDRIGRRPMVSAWNSTTGFSHALAGRAGEASAVLEKYREVCRRSPARGLSWILMILTFTVLTEQAEIGEPFETAVGEFEDLGLKPSEMFRPIRTVPYLIAMGRLAQLRVATEDERPARLEVARKAVRGIAKATGDDLNRARAVLTQADLLVLEDRPEAALRRMRDLEEHLDPDAPVVAYEAARIRARALAALDASAASARQLRLAMSVAQQEGWPHRARWLTEEFGVAAASLTSSGPSHLTGRMNDRQRDRLEALQQVSSAATRVFDPEELARITLGETIRIFAAERAFLFMMEEREGRERLVPWLGRGTGGDEIAAPTGYSASLVERVGQTGAPVVVTGTEEGAALGAESAVAHGLRSIMVAPMMLDGRVRGVVYLDSQVAKGIFTVDDVGILSALTNSIVTSMETARAAQLELRVQAVARQRDLAETLRRSQQILSEAMDPQEVLQQLMVLSPAVTGADRAWMVTRRVDQKDDVVFLLSPGDDGKVVRQTFPSRPDMLRLIELTEPIVGRPELVPDVLAAELAGATSWIAVPNHARIAGEGTLVLVAYTPGADLSVHLEIAAALGLQALTAYDKAFLFSQVQELAVVDDLTGVANRRHFFDVAERDVATAQRHGRVLAAVMIDIDHFKRVNDTYGHGTGDDVIRGVVDRLGANIRATDLIGRYGGEEFALLLPDADPTSLIPERLRQCVAESPVDSRSGPIPVTISVGLAHLTEADENVEALLARADAALYEAKRAGRNRVMTAAPSL